MQIDPIFVVGMNGSGTGALVRSLAQHSHLYAFPGETRVLPYYVQRLARYGDLTNDEAFKKLWNDIRGDHAFTRWHGGIDIPLPGDWRSRQRSLQSAFDGVFRYFTDIAGKSRWCEKSPMNALHIEALANTFPQGRFIHIIRDGRDSALSFHRRWGYHPEMTMQRWKDVVKEARRQGQAIPERYFELQYESLTESPEYWLRQIAEFLDEPFEDAMLTPKRPRGQDMLGIGFVANSGKWRRQLDERQIATLENVAGVLLAELNYTVSNPSGDADFSLLRRWVFLIQDRLRILARLIAQSGSRGPHFGVLLRIANLKKLIGNRLKQILTTRY